MSILKFLVNIAFLITSIWMDLLQILPLGYLQKVFEQYGSL